MTQERRIEGTDEVRRTDEQPALPIPELRNRGSSFVTPCVGDGGSPPRLEAISSTSSMNTTACSSSLICSNVVRRPAATPPGSPDRRDGNTSTNGQSNRDATAFANVVFPVPGGPKSITARGGTTPK